MSLSQIRLVDAVQTKLARGYQNSGYIVQNLFPLVRLDQEGGTIPIFGKELFRHAKTLRALYADRNIGERDYPKPQSYAMEEHELSHPFELREESEAFYNIKTNARIKSQEGVLLDMEILGSQLATNTANYATGHFKTLTVPWDDPSSNPVADVAAGKIKIFNAIRKRANVGWCDYETYLVLESHPALIKQFVNIAVDGMLSEEQIKKALKLDYLFVGEAGALKASSSDDIESIWGDNFGLFHLPQYYAVANPTYDVLMPYWGYTLGKTGYPIADTWEKEGGKTKMMGYTDIFDIKIVGKDSAYLIKNTRT